MLYTIRNIQTQVQFIALASNNYPQPVGLCEPPNTTEGTLLYVGAMVYRWIP